MKLHAWFENTPFFMRNDNCLRQDDVGNTLMVALHIENFMSQGKDSPYDIL